METHMENRSATKAYISRNIRNRGIIIGFALLLLFLILLAFSIGRYHVPLAQVFKILFRDVFGFAQTWTDRMADVVILVRLPRVVCAALVGAALSLSGSVYQGIFHNPLVSPDLLGVSSGACVGASLAILAHMNGFFVQLSALCTGILAVLLSVGISRLFRRASPITLVLSGIIVSALCSSLISLCQYIANVYEELQTIIFWTLGSVATAKSTDIRTLLPAVVIFGGILIALRWRINLPALGAKEARSLGVNIRALRGVTILCSTALTACAVCISGTIGWVGLIVPHLCRLLVGVDNRYVVPSSALLGASFLVATDTLARFVSAAEIPISIITGLIGAPVFILIIAKRRMSL